MQYRIIFQPHLGQENITVMTTEFPTLNGDNWFFQHNEFMLAINAKSVLMVLQLNDDLEIGVAVVD